MPSALRVETNERFSNLANHILDSFAKDAWRSLVMASVVPFCGSMIWYYSRTVIEITDDEQSLWLQTWLQSHQKLGRIRRLMLVTQSAKPSRFARMMDPFGRKNQKKDEDEEKEDGGGRFAPPKLEFGPADGVSSFLWFGWWPITMVRNKHGSKMDRFGSDFASANYILTVWLAPSGMRVAKDILLEGRKQWLAKRSKKTEIWLPDRISSMNGSFKIVTRPSRPLSSVIIDGNTKECIRKDAIRYLNSERWYVSKGIPYRRGYLLHGPPGCGKTSLVTALAGDLRLPIIVIQLNSKDMDDSMLMKVLSETPKDSLILIEDIDCALPRGMSGAEENAMRTRNLGRMPITLSGLLNAIDGVGAQEGRLLFMTTNYVDRLDEALIRPGRVDVKFYLGRASNAAAGELFDQFFVPPKAEGSDDDNDEDEVLYSPDSIQEARSMFLSTVKDGVHSFASLQGVLTSARDDPMLVAEGMRALIEKNSTVEDPIRTDSPWETLNAVKNRAREAKEKEEHDVKAQEEAGDMVVKRLIGDPTSCRHDVKTRTISHKSFTTFGVPQLLQESGVLYFELEIIKAAMGGLPQFGFANKDGIPAGDEYSHVGVGDTDKSWAVDGCRKFKWHKEVQEDWDCCWKEETVVGLAANVDKGMIAVSIDGKWEDSRKALGVVFENEAIKDGVFPCFSASCHKVRYRFAKEDWKYSAPPESVWTADFDEKKNLGQFRPPYPTGPRGPTNGADRMQTLPPAFVQQAMMSSIPMPHPPPPSSAILNNSS